MRHVATGLLVALASWGCPAVEPQGNDAEQGPTLDAGSARDAGVAKDATVDSRVDDSSNDMHAPDFSSRDRPAVRPFAGNCPGISNDGGDPWDGWANLQFPRVLELEVGAVSDPVYGQVWREGETDQAGPAAGWEAELLVGPLGVNPADDPSCFEALPAEYNADVENNDEYWARVEPATPGLYGMYFRYRPPGGAWRIGDANGSDDGVSVAEAGIIAVEAPPDTIRVVTLNLRCQTDGWDQRLGAVVDALVSFDPHVVGFQEDCAVAGEQPQSFAVASALSARTGRGYEEFTLTTHQAMHDEGTFDEGIAMLTAFPIEAHFHVDLPFENFPRVALVMDVRIGDGNRLRLVNTHLDYGAGASDERVASAAAIVAELMNDPVIVTGDFNAEPDSAAYAEMTSVTDDTWVAANGETGGETMPSTAPTRRIDYVFSRALNVESTETFGEDETLSDHLGVFTTLTP